MELTSIAPGAPPPGRHWFLYRVSVVKGWWTATCYYFPGFVSFPECENFFIFTPRGFNVSAEKDLRGFLMKGFDITYTLPSECENCQGSGGRCGARSDGSFVCFCATSAHSQNCSDGMCKVS
ncbi:hypothetical protein AAC387_Pa07g1398 [Persea americana]